jgi:hypothetical protein
MVLNENYVTLSNNQQILYGQQTSKHQQAAELFSLFSFYLADLVEINKK